jgi:hypothetical protein
METMYIYDNTPLNLCTNKQYTRQKLYANQNSHFKFNNFRKSCRLGHNSKKYNTAGEATDGIIITRMRFACWIKQATHVRSKRAILVALQG